MKPFKRASLILAVLSTITILTGCTSAAETADWNMTQAADNFEVNRRIVMFNGITDQYLLQVEGLCSITADIEDAQLEVICKVGKDEYQKHFLGLSDNVSYFIEQGAPAEIDVYHYRVIFRPEEIIPNIDFQGSSEGQ